MSIIKTSVQYFKKLKEIRPSRNIITYLICVVIASILWLLNTLNKEYSAEITYPVKYINFPQGKYPVNKLPTQMQLEVRAKGFALLGYRIKTSFLPITINVNGFNNHFQQNNQVWEYTLNTAELKDKISTQLSNEVKLLNVFPEEINFRMAAASRKKIAILPDLHYTLKRQYIIDQIVIRPDSIMVSGPTPIIDTLQAIYTQPVSLKNVGKNTDVTVGLASLANCTYEDTPVAILLLVEQFTEARRTISLSPRSVPDSVNIRLFPDYVNISYEVGLSKYDKISNDDFTFTVDYPKNTDTPYLDVKVGKIPTYIKDLNYSPQKVEYILEKK